MPLTWLLLLLSAAPDEGELLFARTVRPLLVESCYGCHGKRRSRGGFDLSSRETLLEGGESGAAIVPGDPEGSLLFQMVEHEREPYMPWRRDRLPDADRAALRRWIELGAPYDRAHLDEEGSEEPDPGARDGDATGDITADDRDHWAFRPLRPIAPPRLEGDTWSRTPIDRFILARLREQGLQPSPAADARTLLRRLSLDLWGLPPSFDDVSTLVEDPSGWSAQIERHLKSPRYGERWARHWLDAVRFAESFGFEQDYDRPNAYHYRDFIIRSLYQDRPYDELTEWQIAGDALAPDDPEAWRATGFLAAGAFPTQLTEKEFERARYDELDDIVGTIGTSMLGLTIGCARCHDHKFDAIPSRDYYRMVSCFTKTIRSDVELEIDAEETRAAHAAWQAELLPLESRLAAYERGELRERLTTWLESASSKRSRPWTVLEVARAESEGEATLTVQPDGSLAASGENPSHDAWTVVLRSLQHPITAFRLEALADSGLVRDGPGRAGNGNFALSDLSLTARPLRGGEPVPIRLRVREATFEQKGLPAEAIVDADPVTAWAIDPMFGRDHAVLLEPVAPLEHAGGVELTFRLSFRNNSSHGIGRLRIAVTSDPEPRLGSESSFGSWWQSGPFTAPNREALLQSAVLPAGDLDWRARPDWLDDTAHGLEGEVAVTYLRRSIESPEARRLRFRIGSDDAIRVWMNGDLVHEHLSPRGLRVGEDAVEALLQPGENRLVMAVLNFGGGYGFSFGSLEETMPDGLPLDLAERVRGGEPLSAHQQERLEAWLRESDPEWQRLVAPVRALRGREPKPRRVRILAASEGVKPIPHHADGRGFPHFYETTYFLQRGDPEQKGEAVSPGALRVLCSPGDEPFVLDAEAPDSAARVALARWLTDTEDGAGALLARVIVNRLWHHTFGRGLVATPNDFGTQGAPPTHPDLLEWLAVELVHGGWRLRPLQRLMRESAVYLQTSASNPAGAAIDPENRWLWRWTPRRLEAEAIRDTLLELSGLLDESRFGPGPRDEGAPRRSIYLFQKRGKLLPMMQIFDAPQLLVSIGSRPTTTTAPQALLLMNNENVRQWATAFAERFASEDIEASVRAAYRLALTRDPSSEELQSIQSFITSQLHRYRELGESEASIRRLAFIDLAQALFALNELIYLD
ncbi:MAG: PSD1 and planctomycete cytochrome C domain-containing protein [Planctomycetota bacterium]